VQHVGFADEFEIINQRTVPPHSLGAHSRAAGNQVRSLNFRNEFLQRAYEGVLTGRTKSFVEAASPVLGRHPPQAGKRKLRNRIVQAEVSFAVSLTLESEHSVGAGVPSAVDARGEMHT